MDDNSEPHISGVAAIIAIAFGILIFILLFIFAKRQIMRFALKSPHGPNIPIARNAPKHWKLDIDKKLSIVRDIKYEPKLLATDDSNDIAFDHMYRMKAMDALSSLERAIVECCGDDSNKKRPPAQDLRFYLIQLTKEDGPLSNCDTKLINQFVDCYNSARHEPFPSFDLQEYNHYMTLLNTIRNSICNSNSPLNKRLSSIANKQMDTTAQMVFNGKTQVSLKQKVDFVDNEETCV